MSNTEKITALVQISCRPSERKAWLASFPRNELSRTARALLNAAAKKAKNGTRNGNGQ